MTAACAPTPRLQQADTKVLHATDNQALVRATLQYATAVGAFYDTRDLKVVKEGNSWKVEWPVVKEAESSAAGDPGELPALGRHHSRLG